VERIYVRISFFILAVLDKYKIIAIMKYMGNMVVNHLMFADDISVFSPSISGSNVF